LNVGITIAREFVDIETAKKEGRPAFGEMLRFVKGAGAPKTVLVEKTDRLYRNFRDYVTLEECSLEVHLIKEGGLISPASCSHEKFIHGIKVLMAKNYIDNLSEEVKKGMHEKASKGLFPCHAPIGYKNNKETRGIDIDPVKGPFVRKMFEWYATGLYSLQTICRKLHGEGFTYQKSNPKISKSTLERTLKNPIYMGLFDFLGRSYRGSHTPLVDEALFEAVQSVFRSHNKPKYRKHEFAFGGLMTCADCGCTITAEFKKGKYVYYRCTTRRGACAQGKVIREETLVEQFSEIIDRMTLDPDTIQKVKDHFMGVMKEAETLRAESKAALKEQLEALKDRLDRAYEDRLDGKLSEALWVRKSQEWEREIFRLEGLLNATENAEERFQEEGFLVLDLIENARPLYHVQDKFGRRDFLKIVCSNFYLKDGQIKAEYRQPFGTATLMKEAGGAENQEAPSCEGASVKWSGWRDSNQL